MSTPGERIKAAAWYRVSTTHQDSSNQQPDVERFALHHGYDIVQTYRLEESAWNTKDGYKAEIARALDDAWAGKFKVLIVWALDRLTREGAEGALRLIRQFRERGCLILSVKESWLNSSPEIQDVLVAFAGWMANVESQRRSERIKAGLARRKAAGERVGGRKAGTKDKRQRAKRTGEAKGWTDERRAKLAERNRQRARKPDGNPEAGNGQDG